MQLVEKTNAMNCIYSNYYLTTSWLDGTISKV